MTPAQLRRELGELVLLVEKTERDAQSREQFDLMVGLTEVRWRLEILNRSAGRELVAQLTDTKQSKYSQCFTITARPWWVVFGMDRGDARGFHDDVQNLGAKSVDRSIRILADKATSRGVHPDEVARALQEACKDLGCVVPCETCDATGKIDQRLGGYSWSTVDKCPDCDGEGSWVPTAKSAAQLTDADRAKADEAGRRA